MRMMQTRRRLRKVGSSVMLSIPPEVLKEMNLEVGQNVLISSEGGVLRIEPSIPRPAPDVVQFMQRFTKKYDRAMRNLAQR